VWNHFSFEIAPFSRNSFRWFVLTKVKVRVELYGESWGSQRRCATLLEINLLRSPSSKANINVFIAPQEGVKRNYISQQAVSITRPELFQLRYRLLVAYIYKMSGSVGSRAAIGNAICHKIGFPPQLQSTLAKVNSRHSLNEGLKLRPALGANRRLTISPLRQISLLAQPRRDWNFCLTTRRAQTI